MDYYYTMYVDKFQKHVAKWHLSQKTTYCMSLFIWNSIKDKNYSNKKQISGCPHQGVGGLTAKGHEETFWAMKMFYILIVVVVTLLTVHICHWIVHLK